jgi:NTP pyrophosphatase (non-canonical NTP hydrolase)
MKEQDMSNAINFEQVQQLIRGFHQRFPNGNTSYQMLARFSEEVGELAEQVNMAESGGLLASRRAGFAKEIEDVIRASLTIGDHYQLEFPYVSFADIYSLADTDGASTSPFQIVSQMCETMGAISKKVNHAQGMGIKHQKYGPLDYSVFAHAIVQVVILACSLAQYYQLETDVQEAFRGSFMRMRELGFM